MEHLTMHTIIKFISFEEINDETLKLACEVNSHMALCPFCRKKVESIQRTLDKMLDYEPSGIEDISGIVIDPDIQSEIAKFYS